MTHSLLIVGPSLFLTSETISLPGTRKLSLLGLAVLLRANEACAALNDVNLRHSH